MPCRLGGAQLPQQSGGTSKHAMNRRRGIIRASGRHHGARRRRNAGDSRRAQGWLGWLAIVSLLLHGWLPIVLQVHLAAIEVHRAPPEVHLAAPEVNRHAHFADAVAPSGEGSECPLFHSAICLCAAFVKLLAASGAPVSGIATAARRRRGRVPARRLSRPRPALLFAARAPPVSG